MNVARIRQALESLQELFARSGLTKQASEIGHIASLCHGREHQDANAFLSELKRDATPLAGDELVRSHVNALKAAHTDQPRFHQAFDRLRSDKAVKKPEANAIAYGYVGGRKSWPTKAAAIDAIEKAFVARRYDESKMKIVDQYRPW